MKNLNFLEVGQIFPPLEEAKRIGAIADYDLMFDGNTYAVEEGHFRQTVKNLNTLAGLLGWGSYLSIEYNYFQLCSIKTADFACGEIPDILSNVENEEKREQQQKVIDEIRKATKFDHKLYDSFIDISKYGESYLRVYKNTNDKNTFTLQSPAMIFRVTNEEDDYEVKYYVVAWLTDNDTRLRVQIHEKGQIIKREYKIRPTIMDDLAGQNRYTLADGKNAKSDLYALMYDRATDEVFRCRAFKIVEQIGKDEVEPTYLDDFAIIPLFNTMNSVREHGVSDYDRFDSIVTQMQRTMTQVQLIFDKYTTPTMAVPYEALRDMGGENVMEIGKAIGVPEGGIVPQFIAPDLTRLEMYFRQLEFNEKRIKELSEMGAALANETSTSNISTETMKAQYTSVVKKAERLTTRNTPAIKKLIHMISMHGYSEVISEDDITITWYDGLPNDEEKDVRVATMKVDRGLSNRREEYKNRFNHTDAEFDEMWEQYLAEQSDINTVSSVGNLLNPFNPANSPNDTKEDSGDGADNPDNKTAQTPHSEPEMGKQTSEDGEG